MLAPRYRDGIHHEQHRVPVSGRISTGITGHDRRLVPAVQLRNLDELDVRAEALDRRGGHVLHDPGPGPVVAEVGAYDRNAPRLRQPDHGPQRTRRAPR
jgi:hypothetical protein